MHYETRNFTLEIDKRLRECFYYFSEEGFDENSVFIHLFIGPKEPVRGGLGFIRLIVPKLYHKMPGDEIKNFARSELFAFYHSHKQKNQL